MTTCELDSRESYARWRWAVQSCRTQPAQSCATHDQVAAVWISAFGHTRRMSAWVGDLADDHLALLQSIPVELQIGVNSVAAYCHDIDELSVGADDAAALDEMRALIADSFRILKAEKDNLGPLQRKHWNYLSRVIREI